MPRLPSRLRYARVIPVAQDSTPSGRATAPAGQVRSTPVRNRVGEECGTVAVTGRAVTFAGLGNPVLMAAVALILGGGFGIASETLAGVLTRSPASSASSPESSAEPSPKERSA
jgi:hypothetical protein